MSLAQSEGPILLENLINQLKQLSPSDWKACKEEVDSKRYIPFSSPSLTSEDLENTGGLNLSLEFLEQELPSLFLPKDFTTRVPTAWLCETLTKIKKAFVQTNEMSRRMILDAILIEALLESKLPLYGHCEVKLDWAGPQLGYHGTVDYMFGSSKAHKVIDAFILVLEAKNGWQEISKYQVLAETGCLLRRRQAAGKKGPVFAALSNANFFQFFAIRDDGAVCSSDVVILKPDSDGEWSSSASLIDVLKWFGWFFESMKFISPRVSESNSVDAMALNKVLDCLGPLKQLAARS